MYVIGVRETPVDPRLARLRFNTTRGAFEAYYHSLPALSKAVILLDGAQGGFDGPGSIYPELARDLLENGIATLRLGCQLPDEVQRMRNGHAGRHSISGR